MIICSVRISAACSDCVRFRSSISVAVPYQPTNAPSIRLVKRAGFRYEGTSPDYLFIDGAWRDHERWAITTEMLAPATSPETR